jgi:PII-like signaling protein
MKLEGEQTLLRVYLRNTDKHGWFTTPAAEALVQRAKSEGLASISTAPGCTNISGFRP